MKSIILYSNIGNRTTIAAVKHLNTVVKLAVVSCLKGRYHEKLMFECGQGGTV